MSLGLDGSTRRPRLRIGGTSCHHPHRQYVKPIKQKTLAANRRIPSRRLSSEPRTATQRKKGPMGARG